MRSIALSILSIILLLSLFGNAYLYYSRSVLVATQTAAGSGSSLSAAAAEQAQLPPLAFGTVVLPPLPVALNACEEFLRLGKDNGECRAVRMAPVTVTEPQPAAPKNGKTVAMTPLHFVFTMSGNLLPALPPRLALYRDQGTDIDFQPFLKTLTAMRVPIDTSKFALIPDTVRLQTPDGTYTVTLEPFARTATVSRRQSPSAYRLDSVNVAVPPDADLIAAAQEFAYGLGIQPEVHGQPIVLRPLTVSGGLASASVDVVWPMVVHGKPVIDAVARPVGVVSVRLTLPSLSPQQLTLRQFSDNVLAQSDYTTASASSLQTAVQTGGNHAPFNFEKGTQQKVPVSDTGLAYLFVQDPDGRLPTYFVPVVTASFHLPAHCPTCGPLVWQSFVSALDSQHVSWAKPAAPITDSKKLVR